ncbi:hypothetical protein PBOR_07705 [Paenibacillus borealis]|uniref:Uncharacterized protein n=1 Tax=Paenibacillus borealis TaxID=160799 RepID=A0A089L7R2_PAEBO|nr:hypothetical protein PBOR_07705 [Paenibacillus borealis]
MDRTTRNYEFKNVIVVAAAAFLHFKYNIMCKHLQAESRLFPAYFRSFSAGFPGVIVTLFFDF